MATDYEYGDPPVPVDTEVEYFGRPGETWFRVFMRKDPLDHPRLGPAARDHEEVEAELLEAYPDGMAYTLWPIGVSVGMDNAAMSVSWVSRTEFRVRKGE